MSRPMCEVCGSYEGTPHNFRGGHPCPLAPSRDDFEPGDLVVDDRGKRWVVGRLSDWGRSGEYLWAHPATKSGKIDGRYDGQYISPNRIELLKRIQKEATS